MSSSETTAPRQHAFTGPALTQLPEPTHAERVRAPDILAINRGSERPLRNVAEMEFPADLTRTRVTIMMVE